MFFYFERLTSNTLYLWILIQKPNLRNNSSKLLKTFFPISLFILDISVYSAITFFEDWYSMSLNRQLMFLYLVVVSLVSSFEKENVPFPSPVFLSIMYNILRTTEFINLLYLYCIGVTTYFLFCIASISCFFLWRWIILVIKEL